MTPPQLMYTSVASFLIPLSIYLFKHRGRALTWLFVYLLLSLLCGIASLVGEHYQWKWMYVPANVLVLVRFFLFNYMFYYLFKDVTKFTLRGLHLMPALFTILFVLDSVRYEGMREQLVVSHTIASMAYVVYSIGLISVINRHLPTMDLVRYTPFWVSFGVITYAGLVVFTLMTTGELFPEAPTRSMADWESPFIANIIANLFFAAGMYFGNVKHVRVRD